MKKMIALFLTLFFISLSAQESDTSFHRYNYGLEINPAAALVGSAYESMLLYAGVNILNYKRDVELAFPITFWQEFKDNRNTILNIDAQYRWFMKDKQEGLFSIFGVRISYFTHEDQYYDYIPLSNEYYFHDKQIDFLKFGVCFGMGYRYYSPKGIYWGFAIYIGRYLNNVDNGHDKEFDMFFINTGKRTFLEVEFLKFGYAF